MSSHLVLLNGLIYIDLRPRLSPIIDVNKTEMWGLQTDSARVRQLKERKSRENSALNTYVRDLLFTNTRKYKHHLQCVKYVLKMLVRRYTGLICSLSWDTKSTLYSYLLSLMS